MTITLTWQSIIYIGYILNGIIFISFIWLPEGSKSVKEIYTNTEKWQGINSFKNTVFLWVFTLTPYGLLILSIINFIRRSR